MVAVQDNMHAPAVLAFAALGYDILCEKPMATTLDDCFRIYDAIKDAGIIFGMGHGESVISERTSIRDSGQSCGIRRIARKSPP